MLILSRKVGEEILVPDCNLRFTILAVRHGMVRVGITAPPNLKVWREELLAKNDCVRPVSVATSPIQPYD